MEAATSHFRVFFKKYVLLTLCPPKCFTTQVKCAERPAATVILFRGDINPGSTPVTACKRINVN